MQTECVYQVRSILDLVRKLSDSGFQVKVCGGYHDIRDPDGRQCGEIRAGTRTLRAYKGTMLEGFMDSIKDLESTETL